MPLSCAVFVGSLHFPVLSTTSTATAITQITSSTTTTTTTATTITTSTSSAFYNTATLTQNPSVNLSPLPISKRGTCICSWVHTYIHM